MTDSPTTQGFTLVEMLVAISMLAIIMLATSGALPALTKVNQTSSQQQRAVLLTRAAFEQARQQLELDFDRTTLTVTLTGSGEGNVTCSQPTLTDLRTATIGTSPAQRPMLRRVTMVCTLGSGTGGSSRSYSVDVARPA